MPRTPDRMSAISSALQQLENTMRAMVEENAALREQLQGIVQQAGHFFNGQQARGRSAGAARHSATEHSASGGAPSSSPAIRRRTQRQVEGGKSAASLAKELKVSLPTMYNTLKRAGWRGRGKGRGRPVRGARPRDGMPRKRGRAFKFTDNQAGEFRKTNRSGEKERSVPGEGAQGLAPHHVQHAEARRVERSEVGRRTGERALAPPFGAGEHHLGNRASPGIGTSGCARLSRAFAGRRPAASTPVGWTRSTVDVAARADAMRQAELFREPG